MQDIYGDLFRYEGLAFKVHLTPTDGATPVWRYFDPANSSHFLTASDAERATLAEVRSDLILDGIAFYAYEADIGATLL